MKTFIKVIFSILAVLMGLVVLLVVVLAFIDWNRFREPIANLTERFLGRTLRIEGDLNVDLGLTTVVTAESIRLENAEWAKGEPLLELAFFSGSLKIWPLIFGDIKVPDLQVHHMRGRLETNEEGTGNWVLNPRVAPASDSSSAEPLNLPLLQNVRLKDIHLSYSTPEFSEAKSLIIQAFELGAENTSDPLTFAGNGKLEALPFSLEGRLGSIHQLEQASEDMPFPIAGTFRLADTTTKFEGRVSHPTSLEGLNVHFDSSGDNLQAIAQAIGVEIGRLPLYELTAALKTDEGRVFNLNEIEFALGSSRAAGEVAVELTEPRPTVSVDMVASLIQLDDLKGFIPKAAKDQPSPGQRQQLFGARELPVSMLGLIDANIHFEIQKIRDNEVPDFATGLVLDATLKDRLLQIEPLELKAKRGSVLTYATIDGTVEPTTWDIKSNINGLGLSSIASALTPSPAAGGIQGEIGQSAETISGRLGGEIELKAAGDSAQQMVESVDGTVKLAMTEGSMSALGMELAGADITESIVTWLQGDTKTPIHCMLAQFEINNGRFLVDTTLLATDDSNIWGEGFVVLANEKMDVTLRVRPKDLSIGSLRAPLRIQGNFNDLSVASTAGHMALRAAASVLAGIAAPLAALIPLVETGPGQDNACRQYMDEIRAIKADSATAD